MDSHSEDADSRIKGELVHYLRRGCEIRIFMSTPKVVKREDRCGALLVE